jgi:hypothetical protein
MKTILTFLSSVKLTIVLLFIALNGSAQPPFIAFFGDSIDCSSANIVPFQDSSIFHAGRIQMPGAEINDSYFVMTDTVGNVKWVRRYNYGVNERVQAVSADDSHVYVMLYASNVYHTHIAKIAPDGTTVWAYRYLGEFPFTLLKTFKILPDGIMCAGWVKVTETTVELAVVKLDLDGNIVWSSRYSAASEPAGENPFAIIELANGDFLISGNTNSFGIGNPTIFGDVPTGFMLCISASGEFLWSKGFLSTRLVRDVIETNTNDIIAIDGDWDDERQLYFKMSPEGDVLWTKKIYQEVESDLINMNDLIQTSDQNFLLNGSGEYLTANVPMLFKFDIDGNMLWHREQNLDLPFSVATNIYETNDKGFFAGVVPEFDGDGLFGIMKMDSLGNTACTEELLSFEVVDRSPLMVEDLSFTRSGFVYNKSISTNGISIEIDTSGFMCCDSVLAEIFHENEGYNYEFSATPGSLAAYTWVVNDDTLYGHTIDYTFLGPGTYTICQYADNVCSQDSICETIEVLLDDSGIFESFNSEGLTIYPVPASNEITIKLDNNQLKGIIQVFDFSGQLILENSNFFQEEKLDLTCLDKGIYFVSIVTDFQVSYSGKFIKL